MLLRRLTACVVGVLALSVTAETGAQASGSTSGSASIHGPEYVSAGSTATWSKRCKNGTHTAAWWEGFAWSGYTFLKQKPSFQLERFYDIQVKPGEVPSITLICDDGSRITYDIAIVSDPTLAVNPASVYQGGKFEAKIFCPAPVTVPVLSSSLWGHPEREGEAGSLYYTATVKVAAKQEPGEYEITLRCRSRSVRMPKATATVQILRAVPSPDKPAPAEPEKTTVIIRTGFGGMAAAVAGHHPAG